MVKTQLASVVIGLLLVLTSNDRILQKITFSIFFNFGCETNWIINKIIKLSNKFFYSRIQRNFHVLMLFLSLFDLVCKIVCSEIWTESLYVKRLTSNLKTALKNLSMTFPWSTICASKYRMFPIFRLTSCLWCSSSV